jgi:hypothetical protein
MIFSKGLEKDVPALNVDLSKVPGYPTDQGLSDVERILKMQAENAALQAQTYRIAQGIRKAEDERRAREIAEKARIQAELQKKAQEREARRLVLIDCEKKIKAEFSNFRTWNKLSEEELNLKTRQLFKIGLVKGGFFDSLEIQKYENKDVDDLLEYFISASLSQEVGEGSVMPKEIRAMWNSVLKNGKFVDELVENSKSRFTKAREGMEKIYNKINYFFGEVIHVSSGLVSFVNNYFLQKKHLKHIPFTLGVLAGVTLMSSETMPTDKVLAQLADGMKINSSLVDLGFIPDELVPKPPSPAKPIIKIVPIARRNVASL